MEEQPPDEEYPSMQKPPPAMKEQPASMEIQPPSSLRMLIHLASLKLLLDRVTAKLLGRLAWCLQLHISNFTTLTLMADNPVYILYMIAYQLGPLLKVEWLSEANRKNSKEFQKAFSEAIDFIKTILFWFAITLILHRHSSPLAMVPLNQLIDRTFENDTFFWGHIAIFKLLPMTEFGTDFVLQSFFLVQRYFHIASRATTPLARLLFFEFLDWIWPKRFDICRLIGRILYKNFERYVLGQLLMYVLNNIWILIRGKVFYKMQYWGTPSLWYTMLTTFQVAKGSLRSSRYRTRRQPEVTILEPFECSPIREKDTIRLLLIHPRHPKGPIICSLFQTPLSSVPRYEAISYRWGDKRADKSISVNGRIVMVTPNALEVLKNRSSFWQPKLVWLDSVCINQDDQIEKALQIELMEDIYRKAYIVSAALLVDPNALDFKEEVRKVLGDWVGDRWTNRATSPGVIEYQNEMIKHHMVSGAADLLDDLRISNVRNKSNHFAWVKIYGPQRFSWRVKAFRQLLTNPWFERMWVVQEVALPPSLRILYGDLEIEWTHLVDAITIIGENPMLSGPLLEQGDSVGARVAPPAACTTIGRMDRIRQSVQKNEDRSLGELLVTCRHFIAQEPKDKLFAIRGMCSRLPKGLLKPTESTNKTWEEVYINAAECLVSSGDAAKMLAASGSIPENDLQSTTSLPSWVPNWAIIQEGSPLSFCNEKMNYKAGGPGPVQARVERKSLFVHGILFDDIMELGPIWNVSPFLAGEWNASDLILEKPALFKESYDLVIWSPWTKEPYSGVPNQSLREAFWRTMIGNRSLKENPAPTTLVREFEMYERFWADIAREPERVRGNVVMDRREQEEFVQMSAYSHPLIRCWGGRRVCVTRKGFIGVVPPVSRVGDQVVVFGGMQTPTVVRGRGEGGWEVVGECYVHGVMEGQVWGMGMGLEGREFELV
ncbi:uncharacterized protein LY89DRAFT_713883 [Mollisia scopiformis]|uniref:Heterokaryon incompatibility domain-containing protein n=1 Tax=Mollisia scopiformis TaxID=149040 RepID=A0A194XTF3_MOLSC|nr:uncharacterized protein LY89DRAFT_713883 [Mollisia scopiformis]KUJ23421.1 hypothetical protein LY89DRAFT_713883 [Mollisia scopiformis]